MNPSSSERFCTSEHLLLLKYHCFKGDMGSVLIHKRETEIILEIVDSPSVCVCSVDIYWLQLCYTYHVVEMRGEKKPKCDKMQHCPVLMQSCLLHASLTPPALILTSSSFVPLRDVTKYFNFKFSLAFSLRVYQTDSIHIILHFSLKK